MGLLRGGLRAVTGLIGKEIGQLQNDHDCGGGYPGSSFHAFFNVQGQLEVAGEQDALRCVPRRAVLM